MPNEISLVDSQINKSSTKEKKIPTEQKETHRPIILREQISSVQNVLSDTLTSQPEANQDQLVNASLKATTSIPKVIQTNKMDFLNRVHGLWLSCTGLITFIGGVDSAPIRATGTTNNSNSDDFPSSNEANDPSPEDWHQTGEQPSLDRNTIETFAEQIQAGLDFSNKVKNAATTPGLNSKNKNRQQLAGAGLRLIGQQTSLINSLNIPTHTLGNHTTIVTEPASVKLSQSQFPSSRSHFSNVGEEIAHPPLPEDQSHSKQTDLSFWKTSRTTNDINLPNTEHIRPKREIKKEVSEATNNSLENTTVTNEDSNLPRVETTQSTSSYSTQKTGKNPSYQAVAKNEINRYKNQICELTDVCLWPVNFSEIIDEMNQEVENLQKKIEHQKKHLETLKKENTFVNWTGGSGFLFGEYPETITLRSNDVIERHQNILEEDERNLTRLLQKADFLNRIIINGNPKLAAAWKKNLEDIANKESELSQAKINHQYNSELLLTYSEPTRINMNSLTPLLISSGISSDTIKSTLQRLKTVISGLSKTITDMEKTLNISLKLLDDSNIVNPRFDISKRLYKGLDSENDPSFIYEYTNIINKDIDSLLIGALKVHDINLTPEQLDGSCTAVYRYMPGGRMRPVITRENITIRKLLLGDAHRETSSFPNIKLTNVQCPIGSLTEKQSEKLNTLSMNRYNVLSISDNIMKSLREVADELKLRMSKEPTKLVLEDFLNSLVFLHLMNYSTLEQDDNFIQNEIQRAFFNGILKPEPLLYNGEIVPNIITLGVGNYRFIMSMNSKECYFHDPYKINENLSDFILKNMFVKQKASVTENSLGASKINQVAVVKGRLIKLLKTQPSSNISFGSQDKENGYQDFFNASIDGLVDKINSLTFENNEFSAKTFYENISLLLFISSSILTPTLNAYLTGASTPVLVTANASLESTFVAFMLLNIKAAKDKADRPEDIAFFADAMYSQLLFAIPNIVFSGLNIKTASVTRTKEVIKNFITANPNPKPLIFAINNRGLSQLAKNADIKKSFNQNNLSVVIKKVCPDGVCHGLTLEGLRRLDIPGNGIDTFSESMQSIIKDLKGKNSVSQPLMESIMNKQTRPNSVAYINLNKSASKSFSSNIPQAIEEFKASLDKLSKGDIYKLRVYIAKQDNQINELGHIITIQNIDDVTFELFDPNNGLFVYQSKETLVEATTSYFGNAYNDVGRSYPGAFEIYSKKMPAAASGS